MSPEERKQLAIRGLGMFADPKLVDELVHESWINHEARPENRHGLAGARGTVKTLTAAFADLRFEPHQMLADDDLVAVHLTMSGRHVGAFAGLQPTGRPFAVRHVHLFRIADARLAEHWAVRDDLDMLRQLDVSPAAAAVR